MEIGETLIEYGYSSNSWLAKEVVVNAHPTRVKSAVIQVIDLITRANSNLSAHEVLEMLVQISATGAYYPSSEVEDIVEDALSQANTMLSKEDIEDEVRKLMEGLDEEFEDRFGGEDE